MDQPDKVANPARGQLNRENEHSLVPVRAWEFGLARRVQPSRPASACSSPAVTWPNDLFRSTTPISWEASSVHSMSSYSSEVISGSNAVDSDLKAFQAIIDFPTKFLTFVIFHRQT